MSKDQQDFDLSSEWLQLAEDNFGQAKKAFDQLIANTEKTIHAFENSAQTLQGKAKDMHAIALGYAQEHVCSALTLAQNLIQAKDVSDIIRVQTGFFQDQLKNVNMQAQELSRLATETVTDIGRPAG